MKRIFILISIIVWMCGCFSFNHSQNRIDKINIEGEEFHIFEYDFPYTNKYMQTFLCEKEPFNRELVLSDHWKASPFGLISGRGLSGRINDIIIEIDYDHYNMIVRKDDKIYNYNIEDDYIAKAFHVEILTNISYHTDNSLKPVSVKPISIKESHDIKLNGQYEQVIVFCSAGVLYRKDDNSVFSFIRRPSEKTKYKEINREIDSSGIELTDDEAEWVFLDLKENKTTEDKERLAELKTKIFMYDRVNHFHETLGNVINDEVNEKRD